MRRKLERRTDTEDGFPGSYNCFFKTESVLQLLDLLNKGKLLEEKQGRVHVAYSNRLDHANHSFLD